MLDPSLLCLGTMGLLMLLTAYLYYQCNWSKFQRNQSKKDKDYINKKISEIEDMMKKKK